MRTAALGVPGLERERYSGATLVASHVFLHRWWSKLQEYLRGITLPPRYLGLREACVYVVPKECCPLRHVRLGRSESIRSSGVSSIRITATTTTLVRHLNVGGARQAPITAGSAAFARPSPQASQRKRQGEGRQITQMGSPASGWQWAGAPCHSATAQSPSTGGYSNGDYHSPIGDYRFAGTSAFGCADQFSSQFGGGQPFGGERSRGVQHALQGLAQGGECRSHCQEATPPSSKRQTGIFDFVDCLYWSTARTPSQTDGGARKSPRRFQATRGQVAIAATRGQENSCSPQRREGLALNNGWSSYGCDVVQQLRHGGRGLGWTSQFTSGSLGGPGRDAGQVHEGEPARTGECLEQGSRKGGVRGQGRQAGHLPVSSPAQRTRWSWRQGQQGRQGGTGGGAPSERPDMSPARSMPGRFFAARMLQWTHSIVACSDFTGEFLAEFLGVQAAFEIALRDRNLAVPTLLVDARIDADADIWTDEWSPVEAMRMSSAPCAGTESDMVYNRLVEPRSVLQMAPGSDLTFDPSSLRLKQDAAQQTVHVQTSSRCTDFVRHCPGKSILRHQNFIRNRLETGSQCPKSVRFAFEVQFWFPGPDQQCLSSVSKAIARRDCSFGLVHGSDPANNKGGHAGLRPLAFSGTRAFSDPSWDSNLDPFPCAAQGGHVPALNSDGSSHGCYPSDHTTSNIGILPGSRQPHCTASSKPISCSGLSHVGIRLPSASQKSSIEVLDHACAAGSAVWRSTDPWDRILPVMRRYRHCEMLPTSLSLLLTSRAALLAFRAPSLVPNPVFLANLWLPLFMGGVYL